MSYRRPCLDLIIVYARNMTYYTCNRTFEVYMFKMCAHRSDGAGAFCVIWVPQLWERKSAKWNGYFGWCSNIIYIVYLLNQEYWFLDRPQCIIILHFDSHVLSKHCFGVIGFLVAWHIFRDNCHESFFVIYEVSKSLLLCCIRLSKLIYGCYASTCRKLSGVPINEKRSLYMGKGRVQ